MCSVDTFLSVVPYACNVFVASQLPIRPYQIDHTDCLGQKHDPVGRQKNENKNDQTSHEFN